MLTSACSDHQKRVWKPRSSSENYRLALEAKSADERRDAISRIAESGYVTSDDAFSVLDAAARTDSVYQIRCIAIRAFGRYRDSRPVATLLAILQPAPDGGKQALPPDDEVRLEAATTLAEMQQRGLVAKENVAFLAETFIRLADRRSARAVRIVALRALGSIRDHQVFAPLIDALHENDFAIADTAERSLIALTGTTHDYNPEEWSRWLADTADPFAHAGEKPVTTRPATPGRWEQERRKWQRAFRNR